jgi:hypothetical protein
MPNKCGDLLNADPDIAFIVEAGEGRWIATRRMDSVSSGRHCLWHCPSGPLPLVGHIGSPVAEVTDPFAVGQKSEAAGTTASHSSAQATPESSGGTSKMNPSELPVSGLSSFEWSGNHHKIIGRPAKPETEAWWKRLRNTIKRLKALRVPRSGPLDGPGAEIWTLPSALQKIRNGMARDSNP